MTLLLVRHGATEWTPMNRFLGWTDLPLSAAGRDQAAVLRRSLDGRAFAGVWSSDLTRSIETARIAWGEPRLDRRLREIDFGEIEGRTWNDLAPDTQRALAGFDDFVASNGESIADLRRRVSMFVDQLDPGVHLCFTHGGVIRILTRQIGSERVVQPGEIATIELNGSEL